MSIITVSLPRKLTVLAFAISAYTAVGLQPSLAKAVVSGTLTENTTWTPGGSPYEVNNSTVPAGVTLTIAPGTIAQFLDFARLDVHGRIQANGLANEKIRFTSLSGVTEGNPWAAIPSDQQRWQRRPGGQPILTLRL